MTLTIARREEAGLDDQSGAVASGNLFAFGLPSMSLKRALYGPWRKDLSKPVETKASPLETHAPRQASDRVVFFRTWLQAPFVTATMFPSSRALSRALAAAVDPRVPGYVVELGPGTGPVTAALVDSGIEPHRLVLIEVIPEFADRLRERYPSARVITGNAFEAPSLLRQLGLSPLAAVVSCLPLYAKSPEWRQNYLADLLSLGDDGHRFVQATNFRASPIPIERGRVEAVSSTRIWRNVFPAVVWTYRLTH
jgi:phosphatidylethanolamine/phosphatidyl-N-methylethanolamine N-methyltransferase